MNQRPAQGGAPSWVLALVCLFVGLLVWFVAYGVSDFGVILGMCTTLGGGIFLIAPRSWRRP